jgi:hypothetical protein
MPLPANGVLRPSLDVRCGLPVPGRHRWLAPTRQRRPEQPFQTRTGAIWFLWRRYDVKTRPVVDYSRQLQLLRGTIER